MDNYRTLLQRELKQLRRERYVIETKLNADTDTLQREVRRVLGYIPRKAEEFCLHRPGFHNLKWTVSNGGSHQ